MVKYEDLTGLKEWFPADTRKRARQDEYLSWHHHNTRIVCANLFYLKMGTKVRPIAFIVAINIMKTNDLLNVDHKCDA